ncbi:hypothetical protein NPIL_45121, partial [Nephila pilipes]
MDLLKTTCNKIDSANLAAKDILMVTH